MNHVQINYTMDQIAVGIVPSYWFLRTFTGLARGTQNHNNCCYNVITATILNLGLGDMGKNHLICKWHANVFQSKSKQSIHL